MATTDQLMSAIEALTGQMQQQNQFEQIQADRQRQSIASANTGSNLISDPNVMAQAGIAPAMANAISQQMAQRQQAQQAQQMAQQQAQLDQQQQEIKDFAESSQQQIQMGQPPQPSFSNMWASRNALANNPNFQGSATATAMSQYSKWNINQAKQGLDQIAQQNGQAYSAMVTQNQQPAGGLSTTASVATAGGVVSGAQANQSTGTGVTAPPGAPLIASGQAAAVNGAGGSFSPMFHNSGDPGTEQAEQQQVLTMAMLGEHGAPAVLRNAVMGTYGMQQSINWAESGLQAASQANWMPSVMGGLNEDTGQMEGPLGAMQGALNIASQNPLAAYIGTSMATNAAHAISASVTNSNAVGESLGYSANSNLGPQARSILGFQNPLAKYTSQAAQEGYAYELLKQQMMGRTGGITGLTSDQASQATEVLAGQGFGLNPLNPLHPQSPTGNAANIAQGLFQPIMNQYPGLDASTIGEFTSSLRNAGGSADDVADLLHSLGSISQATSQNINSLASAAHTAGQTFESMGSTSLGGSQAALGFQEITGMQGGIQAATELAQNPMVQGMNLSANGILPSGMGDESPGALTGSMRQTVRMLAQATSGLDRNHYRTVDGVRTLIANGKQQQYDQIASMLHIPSNQVRAMLDPGAQPGLASRTRLQTVLGGEGNGYDSGTGLWHMIEKNQGHWTTRSRDRFNEDWSKATSAKNLKDSGISENQIQQLNTLPPAERLRRMQKLMAKTEQNPTDTIPKDNASAQKVQIEFKGEAARWFRAVGQGNTPAKNTANSGGPGYNSVVNQPGGDPSFNLNQFKNSFLRNTGFNGAGP